MPLSGEPSESVLKALIFAKASSMSCGSKKGRAKRFEHRRDVIKQVQQMLARLGYTSGPINGRLDAKTREAIRKFEADRNLKAAGRLTPRVLLEMVIVSGHPLAANG
jgi:peptidoglycan hydrolase-like protein with peptidoglycan-binding domain